MRLSRGGGTSLVDYILGFAAGAGVGILIGLYLCSHGYAFWK